MPFQFDPDTETDLPKNVVSVSATQVKNFDLCERKWTIESLHKLRAPSSPQMELGTALHKQIEDWYLKGVEPKSLLVKNSLPNLPPRGNGFIAIEKPLEKPDLMVETGPALDDHIPWIGYIDLLHQEIGKATEVNIWDHKSTTSLGWAKTGEDLKKDIQMVSYAKWAFEAERELEQVHLHHHYLVTTGTARTPPVSTTVTREHVNQIWPIMTRRVRDMHALGEVALSSKNRKFWHGATPNGEACGAFGGCPFRLMCDKHAGRGKVIEGVSVFSGFKQSIEEGTKKMAFSDLLKKKVAAVEANTQVAFVQAMGQNAGTVVTNFPGNAPSMAALHAQKPLGALPPDAPAQGPGAPPASSNVATPVLEASDLLNAPTASPAPQAPAEDHNKPRRGRPPGSKNVAQEVAPQPSPAATPSGFILCIGCLPSMGNCSPLEIVVANIAEKIAQQKGIESIHALSYQDKQSLLVQGLKNYPLTGPAYSYTTSDALTESAIISALGNKATMIIRGVK